MSFMMGRMAVAEVSSCCIFNLDPGSVSAVSSILIQGPGHVLRIVAPLLNLEFILNRDPYSYLCTVVKFDDVIVSDIDFKMNVFNLSLTDERHALRSFGTPGPSSKKRKTKQQTPPQTMQLPNWKIRKKR